MTAAEIAVRRLLDGCGGGIAQGAAFVLVLDPCGFADLDGFGDDPAEERDPRAEKLRDWRQDGRPIIKAHAKGGA